MNAFSTFYTFLQNFQDLTEAGSYRFSLNNRLPTASHVASLLITKELPVPPVDKQQSTIINKNVSVTTQ